MWDIGVSDSKCKFLFFNFELVNEKWNKKSSTIELVTQSNFFIFWLRVSYSKYNFLFFNFELVTRKQKNKSFNLIFYEVELVIRKKNFYKNFRVVNLKCNVILRNSVL